MPSSRFRHLPFTALALLASLAFAGGQAAAAPIPESGPSDFTLDPTFATADGSVYDAVGGVVLNFNDGAYQWDAPVGVFPDGNQYWVLGFNRAFTGGDDRLVITRLNEDGSADTSYGTNGRLVIQTHGHRINAATKDGDRFYLAEAVAGANATDFLVECLDTDGAACAGFGMNGYATFAFDLGATSIYPQNDDIPLAILVHDNALYVAGNVPADTGNGVGMLKLDASTGALDAAFGNLPGLPGQAQYFPGRATSDGQAVIVAGSIAFDENGGAERILFSGDAPTDDAGNTNGYVAAVDASSGALQAGFGEQGFAYVALHDGENFSQTPLNSIHLRPDGHILAAGTYTYDVDGITNPEILLAEFDANGTPAASFGNAGVSHLLIGYNTFGLGVTERSNGDVVVTLSDTNLFPAQNAPICHSALLQTDRNGNTIHALQEFFYVSDAVDTATCSMPITQGVLIDDQNRTLVFGSRAWKSIPRNGINDIDVTLTRFTAEDSLFSSGFEGTTN